MESLKPGDKVRLKHLENWIISHDAAMIVKHVGEFADHGVTFGALCLWINPKGRHYEKVYPMDALEMA